MPSATPKRRSPRLKGFPYTGSYVYNLTFVTRQRLPVLNNEEVAELCLQALAAACRKYRFTAFAYCLMPDHMHVLSQGSESASLEDFVRHFKQLSGYGYKQSRGAHLWQISYYDHVLRSDEAIRPVAEYIWDNPVRAGLASERSSFPFNGPPEYLEES